MLISVQRMMTPLCRRVGKSLNTSILTSASFITNPIGIVCHRYNSNAFSKKQLEFKRIKFQTKLWMTHVPLFHQHITIQKIHSYLFHHTNSNANEIIIAKQKKHQSPMVSGTQLHIHIKKFFIRIKKKSETPQEAYITVSKEYRKKTGDDISFQQFYHFYKDNNLKPVHVEHRLSKHNKRIDCICEESDGTYTLYDWKRSDLNLNELCNRNSTKMNEYKSILKTLGIKVHRMLIATFHPNKIGYQVGQIPIQPKKKHSMKKVNK